MRPDAGRLQRIRILEARSQVPRAVFLDRDGVINENPEYGDYVKSWQ